MMRGLGVKSGRSTQPLKVKVINYNFVPRNVKIRKGESVRFEVVEKKNVGKRSEEVENKEDADICHQISFINGNNNSNSRGRKNRKPVKNSPLLRKGDKFTVTFDQAGTFEYYCSQYVFMTGTIQVVGAGGNSWNAGEKEKSKSKRDESLRPEEEVEVEVTNKRSHDNRIPVLEQKKNNTKKEKEKAVESENRNNKNKNNKKESESVKSISKKRRNRRKKKNSNLNLDEDSELLREEEESKEKENTSKKKSRRNNKSSTHETEKTRSKPCTVLRTQSQKESHSHTLNDNRRKSQPAVKNIRKLSKEESCPPASEIKRKSLRRKRNKQSNRDKRNESVDEIQDDLNDSSLSGSLSASRSASSLSCASLDERPRRSKKVERRRRLNKLEIQAKEVASKLGIAESNIPSGKLKDIDDIDGDDHVKPLSSEDLRRELRIPTKLKNKQSDAKGLKVSIGEKEKVKSMHVNTELVKKKQGEKEKGVWNNSSSSSNSKQKGKKGLKVQVKAFEFQPKLVSINEGENITWVVGKDCEHPFCIEGPCWDPVQLKAGEKFTFTFNTRGTFRYKCNLYPWMKGTIKVSPGLFEKENGANLNSISKKSAKNSNSDEKTNVAKNKKVVSNKKAGASKSKVVFKEKEEEKKAEKEPKQKQTQANSSKKVGEKKNIDKKNTPKKSMPSKSDEGVKRSKGELTFDPRAARKFLHARWQECVINI